MIEIEGLWWPDDVGEKWRHSLRHVQALEWAIAHCSPRRTAVQAGGNMGIWPRRLAQKFARVVTFEPEPISLECLRANCGGLANVTINAAALGAQPGTCEIDRKSLGSHKVRERAGTIAMVALDQLQLEEVDLIALDVEGYELHALRGARETIRRWHPLIQVEQRGFTETYGGSDAELAALLAQEGYRVVSRQGADVVYRYRA